MAALVVTARQASPADEATTPTPQAPQADAAAQPAAQANLAAQRAAIRAVMGTARQANLASQSDVPVLTNVPTAVEEAVLSNELGQASELVQTNDNSPNDELSQTNGASSSRGAGSAADRSKPITGRDYRRQFEDRKANRNRARAGSGSEAGSGALANTVSNRGPAKLDYAAFKIIVDRNIFDPNRHPARQRPTVKPKEVEYFALKGTMTYEKGTFAFFDGSGSEYQKALKTSDIIAGYKVTDIKANAVKLATGTNELELGMGMQIRREDGGPWLPPSDLAGSADSYSYSSSSSSSSGAASTGAASTGNESDILKRLRERREKE
jgi:hypothetical protein